MSFGFFPNEERYELKITTSEKFYAESNLFKDGKSVTDQDSDVCTKYHYNFVNLTKEIDEYIEKYCEPEQNTFVMMTD